MPDLAVLSPLKGYDSTTNEHVSHSVKEKVSGHKFNARQWLCYEIIVVTKWGNFKITLEAPFNLCCVISQFFSVCHNVVVRHVLVCQSMGLQFKPPSGQNGILKFLFH